MTTEIKIIVGLVGVAAAAIGYAFGQKKKLNDISAKLDKSIDDIAENTMVTVSEDIVEKAVKKAVDNNVGPIVSREISAVATRTANEMRLKIEKKLEELILDSIKDEDVDKMKATVLDRATSKATAKMTDGLDYIFDDFRRSMARVTRRYTNVGSI